MILDVPAQTLIEVVDVIASVARMVVQVGWVDKMLGKITIKKKHMDLLWKPKNLTKELEQLDRKRDEITQALAEIDTELVYNKKLDLEACCTKISIFLLTSAFSLQDFHIINLTIRNMLLARVK